MNRTAVLAVLAAGAVWAQEPVIRVTANLVQIDAVVTDRSGKLVTNLEAADFEILQDGKRRDITAFSLVEVAPPASQLSSPGQAPLQGITRDRVRRTIAILVDDLNIGFADMARVRQAVTRFIAEDLREGDLCAIITTRGGMGIYSQFTTDRILLAEAAKKLVWGQPPVFDPGTIPGVVSEEVRMLKAGSVASIRSGIQGMREMPGRKSIVLFSSGGITIEPGDGLLQSIADEATRAAVTLYTVQAEGLTTLAPRAEDGDFGAAASRRISQQESMADMSYLAQQTGGIHFRNDNGLREILGEALEDQRAYYLLGYNPGEGSFDRKFHKIEVRVLRPGLRVRSRAGYMGVEDRPGRRTLEPSSRRIVSALLSPFQSNDIHTRLTAAFRSEQDKPRIVSQLWIDGKDLTFAPGEGGRMVTEMEVVVANFDPQGALREHTERAYRLKLTEAELAEVRRSGLLYSITYDVKKPGPYHVRMAVRERGTLHIGTASQFLITPDIGKDRLALSGIVVKGLDDRSEDIAKPWLSLLKLGSGVEWTAQVYHPKLKQGVPNLKAAMRVYRGGELIAETEAGPVAVEGPFKKKQIDTPLSGTVGVGKVSEPGEYVLEVIISDENDKAKTVSQSLAFQVAP